MLQQRLRGGAGVAVAGSSIAIVAGGTNAAGAAALTIGRAAERATIGGVPANTTLCCRRRARYNVGGVRGTGIFIGDVKARARSHAHAPWAEAIGRASRADARAERNIGAVGRGGLARISAGAAGGVSKVAHASGRVIDEAGSESAAAAAQ